MKNVYPGGALLGLKRSDIDCRFDQIVGAYYFRRTEKRFADVV